MFVENIGLLLKKRKISAPTSTLCCKMCDIRIKVFIHWDSRMFDIKNGDCPLLIETGDTYGLGV